MQPPPAKTVQRLPASDDWSNNRDDDRRQAGATTANDDRCQPLPTPTGNKGERAFLDAKRGGRGLTPRASRPRAAALALVGFVGLCLLVGAAGTALVRDGGWAWYMSLRTPPGTPPTWLFTPLWTALYTAVGTAAWLVWRRFGAGPALRLWGWQIAANAFWTPAFFGVHQIALALAVNLVLLVLVALITRAFARLVPAAGWLMLPCLGWTIYAVYLNAGLWWLNRV